MKPHYLKVDSQTLALALMQRTDITRLDLTYSALVGYDYAMIEPWLPQEANRILDIGAGLAAIDVHLARRYQASELYLLDRNEFGSPVYGEETVGEFYNSNDVTLRFLTKNGVAASRVHFLEATDKYNVKASMIDLCVSLFSWGWHYPVGAYAKHVARAMNTHGLLVLDVRNEEGINTLNRHFDFVRTFYIMDGERRFYRRNHEVV